MKTDQQKQQLGAFLIAAAGVIFFSAKAVFVKMAYAYDIDTVSLILIRMLMAMPIYLAIVLLSIRKWRRRNKLSVKQFLLTVLMGFFGYYLSSYLDFSGLHYISASMERLVLFIYPTLVVAITALWYRKPVPARQLYAIGVTYFGIFLTFYQSVFVNHDNGLLLGIGLVLGCALSYACFMVGSGKLIPEIGAVRFTCYAMLASGMAVLAHYTLQGNTGLGAYPHEIYWIGAGMAIFSTVLPSFMIAYAIKYIGASHVAIMGSIGPFATIIMAAIVLDERITAFQALGALIVISGVLLITSQARKAPVPEPAPLDSGKQHVLPGNNQ